MTKKQEHSSCCAPLADSTNVKHAREMSLVNRVGGQVEGIGRMIQEGRYCPDILNQIRAARAALRTLESRVLETHLHTCVRESFSAETKKEQDVKIEEILHLFRRYDND
ncbi:MAG: metal-sensitive transcriptional regulator [Micavibrio sp.]|nr:metal-sensitive transcriptional regulator [Micavibrio sp.]